MLDSMLGKLADLLVKYSVEVNRGDEVLVNANLVALPLVKELYRAILESGGYPISMLGDELLEETFYRYADEETLRHLSPIEKFMVEEIDARISIRSSTHTKYLSTVDPSKIRIRSASRRELMEIFMKRDASGDLRWVVVAYPTKALAQEAEMGLLDYEEFVFRACALHLEDPVKFWMETGEKQGEIIDLLSKASEIRFVAEDTDLTVRVDGRKWVSDDGHKNMPGGEVFTAPVEDSVEGVIKFTYPAIWRGVEVKGVRLVFRRGRVEEANAAKGEDFLRNAIRTDGGASGVGEIAFGLNYNIAKFTKNILFDEKIGGTIHLALGAAYPETGGMNKSAIHWDMIKDMSRGRVYIDGELAYENGRFVI